MSSPIIFVLIPLLFAFPLWLLRHQRLWVLSIGTALCALLVVIAALVPLAAPIRLGNLMVQIPTSLSVFGRQFIISDIERPRLMLLYGMGVFWGFGSLAAKVRGQFMAYALAILALMVAAVSVHPFLYAAVLIEIAVLISVPMMIEPGRKAGRGLVRFVIFQSLAMPFILMAGWAFSSSGLLPGDENALRQTVLIFALGFAFWLAVFPFYTWVPMVAAEVQPYAAGFVLGVLPTAILLFLLDFLNAYPFLRESNLLFSAFRWSGILMVFTSGIWALFERNLARLVGYALILEVGLTLIALSLHSQMGLEYYVMAFIPRQIVLALMVLSLSVFKSRGINLTLQSLAGSLRTFIQPALAYLIALAALGGLPLLAMFPLRITLLSALATQDISQIVFVLIGLAGFLFAFFRVMAYFSYRKTGGVIETTLWFESSLLLFGVILVIAIGLFPAFFVTPLQNLLSAFVYLTW